VLGGSVTATAWVSSTGDCSIGNDAGAGLALKVGVEAEEVNRTTLNVLVRETASASGESAERSEMLLASGAAGIGKTGGGKVSVGALDVDTGSVGVCKAGVAGIDNWAVAIRG
jgi:hypothetical protein